MKPQDKILVEAYLKQSLDDFELSAGRIILDSGSDIMRAGKNEDEESRRAAREFISSITDNLREVICQKYKEKFEKAEKNSSNILELVGHISAIIAASGLDVSGLSYLFIASWIFKNGLSKLCQEESVKSQ